MHRLLWGSSLIHCTQYLTEPTFTLKILQIIKISSYFLKTEESLFSTILSVRGSLARLKSFPESSRIWGSVRGTFNLRSFCIQVHSGVDQT